ncbi:hypothetical protein PR202_ga06875 [Eleusine coracana subsp. coracana]|uniref:Beta'-coat protein n=1 Tax=Eleusine coracana subsp. coracana TaxID=191504 RepID=A0AAV5BX83_ELECO|nr:hypothetical protein PR202_ga06875 [Eleusine coracana subsp. coracana]
MGVVRQPLRLDIKRKLAQRSERVKSVDLHPTEPWILSSLYSGSVCIWNYQTQTMVKSFEVTDLPGMPISVRSAKFIARKQWVVAGADDMFIRVYNYNTMDKVKVFEAHTDYIRCVAVHPTQPFVLSSSDDMLIKLWDWDKGWVCTQIFEGHSHYVMQVTFNPKDTNTFASASLDRTIKIWSLGSPDPNFTLDGHSKGVNCVDYFTGGDRPYLITGSDDQTAKVNDTGYLDFCRVVIGYDEGTIMIKIGREVPVASMDSSGKIIWAKHNEIQTVNIKTIGADNEIPDGERLPLAVKELGSCDLYPQEKKSIRPAFSAERIFGGVLLAMCTNDFICFYDWAECRLIRRIDVNVKNLYWADSGDLVTIASDTSFYILKYNVTTLFHLDRPMYLLGYLANQSRVYLIDKQFNVVGYTLLLSLIEYKTLVMRGDFDRANAVLSSIPKEQYDSVARFLESRGMLEEALEIATDTNYRFDLAVQLGRLEIAKAIATEVQSESKWKQLGELAMSSGKLEMAEECLLHAADLSGLLLLYSSLGDAEGITKLASVAKEQGKNNVSFLSFFMLGKLEECLQLLIESNRIPEAALMARSYLPSKVPEIVALWKKDLQKVNPKAAESLADPEEYPNLFEDWHIALNVEATIAPKRGIYPPAEEYMIHAERSNDSLVEAFKNMQMHEEVQPDDNEDTAQEVIEDDGVEESQEDAVEVDAENGGVEESQDDAVEVEAEGSTDGVLVNGNSSEEQWGTKNEEPSA